MTPPAWFVLATACGRDAAAPGADPAPPGDEPAAAGASGTGEAIEDPPAGTWPAWLPFGDRLAGVEVGEPAEEFPPCGTEDTGDLAWMGRSECPDPPDDAIVVDTVTWHGGQFFWALGEGSGYGLTFYGVTLERDCSGKMDDDIVEERVDGYLYTLSLRLPVEPPVDYQRLFEDVRNDASRTPRALLMLAWSADGRLEWVGTVDGTRMDICIAAIRPDCIAGTILYDPQDQYERTTTDRHFIRFDTYPKLSKSNSDFPCFYTLYDDDVDYEMVWVDGSW